MALTSKSSFQVLVTGNGETAEYQPQANPVTNASAPAGGVVKSALAAGDNTLTLPTGAIGVMIVPPTDSANGKVLKGVGGDTGIALHRQYPTTLFFHSTVTDFVINSVGSETVELHWL
jgi:hypothetical protein